MKLWWFEWEWRKCGHRETGGLWRFLNPFGTCDRCKRLGKLYG